MRIFMVFLGLAGKYNDITCNSATFASFSIISNILFTHFDTRQSELLTTFVNNPTIY